jgi:radical SAM protein with 4Fe4S-binding SPASM domain
MLISINGLSSAEYEMNCGRAIDADAMRANIRDLYNRRGNMLLSIKIADDGTFTEEYKRQFINLFEGMCDIINIDKIIASGFWKGIHTDRGYENTTMQDKRIRERKVCPFLFYATAVKFDGSFYPCCQEHAGESPFGNIGDANFSDLWESNEFKKARRFSLERRQEEYPFCSGCGRYMFSSSAPEDDIDPFADEILDRLVNDKYF